MSSLVAKRTHEICAGHRVTGHEGCCSHLHGHGYIFTFTVQATEADSDTHSMGADEIGRVLDFSVIKSQLCQWLEDNWDHRFLIWENDPDVEALVRLDETVQVVPFNPTAEAMAMFLTEIVGPKQLKDTGCTLVEVTVQETGKCSAIYKKTPKVKA